MTNNASPAPLSTTDLMQGYLTTAGLLSNTQELVLMRLHLKVSVTFTSSGAGAANGIGVGVWVDSRNQNILGLNIAPYDQQYLVYDELYESETRMEGGTTPFNMSRTYDVRARRKVAGLTDTVWLQFNAQGLSTTVGWSIVMSMLMKST